MRGGVRTGAGRKPGGTNRISKEAQENARIAGLMPLDYMLAVMRDLLADDTRRLDAAKSAAPYLHHKLQPTDGHGDTAQTIIVQSGVPRAAAN